MRVVAEEQFDSQRAKDRDRKRRAKQRRMAGYARSSIAIIAPRTGVKKGKSK